MHTPLRILYALLVLSLVLVSVHVAAAADDPLSSWNDGAAKRAIVDFVQRVTVPSSKDFVSEPERIATFDNDGTLWAEQPMYFQFIGRRPLLVFGNSDGDHQMLQWTAAGHGARFVGLVHHTDAEREWSYDRTSSVGQLDKALDEARARSWTIVDMKQDWKTIFPPPDGR